MRVWIGAAIAAICLGCPSLARAVAAEAAGSGGITIDVPVVLKEAKVVFDLDRLAFEGDEPTGLAFLRVAVDRFREDGTKSSVVANFHGAAGYMLLNDAVYDRVRSWSGGNPYRTQIAALVQAGVVFEECGQTMLDQHWVNGDLLDGVKVNTGANFRIIELVQDGYVQIQP